MIPPKTSFHKPAPGLLLSALLLLGPLLLPGSKALAGEIGPHAAPRSSFAGGAAVDLNLSSTKHSLTSPSQSAVTITIGGAVAHGKINGGEPFSVLPGQQITSAQYAAVMSAISGHQTIIVDSHGVAVGGALTWTPTNMQHTLGSIVVPKNVAMNLVGFNASSPLNITGTVTNYGVINALSNKSGAPAFINSDSLIVNSGAQLSAFASTAKLSGTYSPSTLNFKTTNNIVNNGKIAAPAGLTLTAGGSISNVPTGGSKPSISASNINLNAGTGGTITNAGQIKASQDLNFNTRNSTQNLAVDNTNGNLTGNTINFRNNLPGFDQANSSVSGGTMSAAHGINMFGSDIEAHLSRINGAISITGRDAHVSVSHGRLTLGKQNLSADPTYYNSTGDIFLSSLSGIDGDIAVVAAGNIVTTGPTAIQTTTADRSIFLAAGLNFTADDGSSDSGGGGSGGSTGTITFTGTTNPGMNINAAGNELNLAASGAGSITIIATGSVNLGSGSVVAAENGSISIIHGTGFAAQGSTLSTSAGNINIAAAVPDGLAGTTVTSGTLSSIPTAGTSTFAANVLPAITTSSGNVNVAGGNVTIDNLNAGAFSNITFDTGANSIISQVPGTQMTAGTVTVTYGTSSLNLTVNTPSLILNGSGSTNITGNQLMAVKCQNITGTLSVSDDAGLLIKNTAISADHGITLTSQGAITLDNSSLSSSNGTISITTPGAISVINACTLTAGGDVNIKSLPQASGNNADITISTGSSFNANNIKINGSGYVTLGDYSDNTTPSFYLARNDIAISSGNQLSIQNCMTMAAGSLNATAPPGMSELSGSNLANAGSISFISNSGLRIGYKDSFTANGGDFLASAEGNMSLTGVSGAPANSGSTILVNGGNIDISGSINSDIVMGGDANSAVALTARMINGSAGNITVTGAFTMGASSSMQAGAAIDIAAGTFVGKAFVQLAGASSLMAAITSPAKLSISGYKVTLGAIGGSGPTLSTLMGNSAINISAGLVTVHQNSQLAASGSVNIVGNAINIGDSSITAGSLVSPPSGNSAPVVAQAGHITIVAINGGGISITGSTLTSNGSGINLIDSVTVNQGDNTSHITIGNSSQLTANGGNIIMASTRDIQGVTQSGYSQIVIKAIASSTGIGGGIEIGAGLLNPAPGFGLDWEVPVAAAGNYGGGISITQSGNVASTNLNNALNTNLPAFNPPGGSLGAQVTYNNQNGAGGAIVVHNSGGINLSLSNPASLNISQAGAIVLDAIGGSTIHFDDGSFTAVGPIGFVSTHDIDFSEAQRFNTRHAIIACSSGAKLRQDQPDDLSLAKGEIFVEVKAPLRISAGVASIKASGGSLFSVRKLDGCTYVRACDTTGGVTVEVGESSTRLHEGEELVVTDYAPTEFEINPKDGIGRRDSHTRRVGDYYLTLRDFSIITFLSKSEAFMQLRREGNPQDRRLLAQLLKNAAIVDQIFRYRGAYTAQSEKCGASLLLGQNSI